MASSYELFDKVTAVESSFLLKELLLLKKPRRKHPHFNQLIPRTDQSLFSVAHHNLGQLIFILTRLVIRVFVPINSFTDFKMKTTHYIFPILTWWLLICLCFGESLSSRKCRSDSQPRFDFSENELKLCFFKSLGR